MILRQDAVEDQLPDIPQHDTADQVRHKEDRTENISSPHLLRQRHGEGKCDHVDHYQ